MRTVVLVGRRPDGGHRDRLWAHCRKFWSELGFPVYEGADSGSGPFCLAAASNDAARLAGDWELAVYAGADVVTGSPSQVVAALAVAENRGLLVFSHDHYYSLSAEGTELVLAGEPVHGRHAEWPPWPNTFSSMFAIPRSLWDQVGGFDERFQGWGFEDLAFWSACCALSGHFERVTGPVFHLHHERASRDREQGPNHAANEDLGRRYLAAKDSPDVMREILAER